VEIKTARWYISARSVAYSSRVKLVIGCRSERKECAKEEKLLPLNGRTESYDVPKTFPRGFRDDLPGLVIKRYRRSTHGRHKRSLIIAGDSRTKGAFLAAEGPRRFRYLRRKRTHSADESVSRLRDQVHCWRIKTRDGTLNQLERTRRSWIPSHFALWNKSQSTKLALVKFQEASTACFVVLCLLKYKLI